jgi:small nuclear ribonucleoprotein (snRNP)-like protein
MTDDEVRPWVGRPVRITLDDGQVLAGTLHAEDAHGHGHSHYAVVSDPVREGGDKAVEMIHGAERITLIEDASDDPAAIE